MASSINQLLHQSREESQKNLDELAAQVVFLQQQFQELSKQLELVQQRNAEKDQSILQLNKINELNQQELQEYKDRTTAKEAEQMRLIAGIKAVHDRIMAARPPQRVFLMGTIEEAVVRQMLEQHAAALMALLVNKTKE